MLGWGDKREALVYKCKEPCALRVMEVQGQSQPVSALDTLFASSYSGPSQGPPDVKGFEML